MEALVRAKAPDLEGLCLVDQHSKPYGVLRATGDSDQQSLLSEYEITRGDLGQILYGYTKDNLNVRYLFGETIESISQ